MASTICSDAAVELITTGHQMASLLVSSPPPLKEKRSQTDKDVSQVRLHHIFHKE